MPIAPYNTKCQQLGCKNSRSALSVYCLSHGGKDKPLYNAKYNAKRKETNNKYYTRQWEVLRQRQLSKHPLCAGCQAEGRIVAANVVDHLFPWTQISEQAFYINRFQSLCATHHATKTQLERHGIYRAFGTPQRDYGRSDYAHVMGVADPLDAEARGET